MLSITMNYGHNRFIQSNDSDINLTLKIILQYFPVHPGDQFPPSNDFFCSLLEQNIEVQCMM